MEDNTVLKDLLSDEEELVVKGLKTILKFEDDATDEDEEKLGAFYSELCKTLKSLVTSKSGLVCNICESVASLARIGKFKEIAASSDLASSLCPHLSSPDRPTQIQALRAVGNLCSDEDTVREQCATQGAHRTLNGLLKDCIKLKSDDEVIIKYKTVVCGCTLNLCCRNEKLSGLLLELGAIESLSQIISNEANEVVLRMALHALHVIIEADCCTVGHLMDSSLSDAFKRVLSLSSNDIDVSVLEKVLEIIEMSINDEVDSVWKVKLVSSDCFQELLSLIGSEISEKIFNIIVLLISSDEAMKVLFENDELYKILVDHIRNEGRTPKVRAAAILVIANMARTDSNCEELIRRDLLMELADIVKGPAPTDEMSPVWFSVMSVLRNLALPGSSKGVFLQTGVIDNVVNVLNVSSDANVLMKTIGCLRLLSKTDDVCKHLIDANPVFTRVHAVSEMFSIPHIKIEASRLCATLIKSSQSSDDRLKLLSEDNIYPLLLYLLQSEYTVLKNEGLIALTIAASFSFSNMMEAVTNEETVESIVNILEQEESVELKQNCLTLLKVLLDQSDGFVQLVQSNQKLQPILNQLSNLDSSIIKELIVSIKGIIEHRN